MLTVKDSFDWTRGKEVYFLERKNLNLISSCIEILAKISAKVHLPLEIVDISLGKEDLGRSRTLVLNLY